jgi:hypothetical protein
MPQADVHPLPGYDNPVIRASDLSSSPLREGFETEKSRYNSNSAGAGKML